MTLRMPKNKAKLLKQLYSEYQLEQLIKDHTWVAVRATKENKEHTSKTLTDHVSTNKPQCFLCSGVLQSGIRSKISRILEKRSFRTYDKEKFLNDLKEVNWELVLSPLSETPNLIFDKFREIFYGLPNTYAPIRSKKIRNQPAPWIALQIKD